MTTTETNTETKRKPSHRAYAVKGDGDKARWIEIGAAWPTRDGNGFTLQLDALPINGRVILQPNDGGQQ